MPRVFVTGASGFIGAALVPRLQAAGYDVDAPQATDARVPVDTVQEAQWARRLQGVDFVVHLAARAHVVKERAENPLIAFRAINAEGTARVARAAAGAGVRRFVFVSSIGVLGSQTDSRPFSDSSPTQPAEPYAVSKLEAEITLREICSNSAMDYVIVRPPLVCGAGAKGNLHRLLSLADSPLPLPFREIRNSRSFIGVRDISDLLVMCLSTVPAANEVFVASDRHTISTVELIALMRRLLHRPERIISCPSSVLTNMASLVGRASEFERMTASLVVDTSRVMRIMGWSPKFGLYPEIESMVQAHSRNKKL